jgi:AcrR family transcriptional regulator
MASADDTRQRLLEAAVQVFAELGKDAPVRRILEAASIKNIAAVNYYFGDKDQLYEAALRHAFCAGPSSLKVPTFPADVPPTVKLYEFIRAFARHVAVPEQNDLHLRLVHRELMEPSASGELLLREFIRPTYEKLWGLLREVLGPELPEETIHLLGFSIVGQCVYHRIGARVLRRVVGEAEHATYTRERLADHIAAFSLAALGLKVPSVEEVSS